jgi:hypothetical protein
VHASPDYPRGIGEREVEDRRKSKKAEKTGKMGGSKQENMRKNEFAAL